MIRTFLSVIEANTGIDISRDGSLFPWLVEHVGQLVSRYKVGSDGRTSFHRLRGKRASNIAVPYGEKILFMPTENAAVGDGEGISEEQRRRDKLDMKYEFGIYVGICDAVETRM